MISAFQIVAFEGGKLRALPCDEVGREAVLGLSLNRLLAKVVRVPAGDDPVAFCTPILKGECPYPDDPLAVSCELVREDEAGKIVIAAAFPESSGDDIAEAVDAAKLSIVKIDLLVLGLVRGIWSALGETTVRRMILSPSADCLSLVVLDGSEPVALRAITNRADLKRELMLSLLEAEDFGGARKLEEIVLVEAERSDEVAEGESAAADGPVDPFAELETFAPVRRITIGSDAALAGIAERATDAGSLNVLPESWGEVLEETRFKAKLVKWLAVAGGIWLLAMGVLFGVPMVYDFMADHQKSLSKQHQRQYVAVKEMKAKVDLIHKYSDHARGALEVMKAVSDRLPEGVTLNSWNYRREEGVRVSGEADTAECVYRFKDVMDEMSEDGEDGDTAGAKIFGIVDLSGPNAAKGGVQRFELNCQYQKEEEE